MQPLKAIDPKRRSTTLRADVAGERAAEDGELRDPSSGWRNRVFHRDFALRAGCGRSDAPKIARSRERNAFADADRHATARPAANAEAHSHSAASIQPAGAAEAFTCRGCLGSAQARYP